MLIGDEADEGLERHEFYIRESEKNGTGNKKNGYCARTLAQ